MSRLHIDRPCVLARVFAPTFATLPLPYSGRSSRLPTARRDGTDPLIGGHAGAPGARFRPHCQRQGGRP